MNHFLKIFKRKKRPSFRQELQLKKRSNQITFIVTSPQHKCLGEWNSYERAPDSAEKQQTIYIWTDSAKNCTGAFTVLQTVQKKQQQQFTYGQTVQKKQQTIYIWTDSAKKQQQQFTYGQTVKKNNSNLHMDSTYLQTVQKTMCKIHIHALSTHSVL